MDRHGKVARKDEGISLGESCRCYKSGRTNGVVSREGIEGRFLSRTNTCKLKVERPLANYIQDISIVLVEGDPRSRYAAELVLSLHWSTIS